MFLTDEHWRVLKPILEPAQTPRRGRPWKDSRAVLEAIFFILHTGISVGALAQELSAEVDRA